MNDTDHNTAEPKPNPPGRDSSKQGNQPGRDQQSGKGKQRDSSTHDGERDAPKR